MNKVKIVKKMGTSQLMIKSLKGQQLSEHEVYSINNNEVRGLLHLDVVQKNNSFKLFYNVTGFVSFREFLRTPLILNGKLLHHMIRKTIKAVKYQ